MECEESLTQMKGDMASSMVQNTAINQVYKGIVDQIDIWIKLGVLTIPSSESNNATMNYFKFTPINYVTMYVYILFLWIEVLNISVIIF